MTSVPKNSPNRPGGAAPEPGQHHVIVTWTDSHDAMIEDDQAEGITHEHDQDCYAIAVECSGVTDQCRMWRECRDHQCTADRTEAERLVSANADADRDEDCGLTDDQIEWVTYGEPVSHGEEHRLFDGDWMTPTEECLAEVLDSDDAWEIAEKRGIGRWPVEPDMPERVSDYIDLVDLTEPADSCDGADR